jgi:UDP-glucose 4-epimerase
MRAFVIGGAGFIGSHLVDRLVTRGEVTVFDNLSIGKREFIADHLDAGRAKLVLGDALDLDALRKAMAGHDLVFHLAANPEARWGLERTRLDLDQGTIATYNALEAARLNAARDFVFSSSGTVYGNTTEACAEMGLGHLPISLYGASKLAGEALIAAYAECFGLRGFICRFGNIVGGRGTHGAIVDFCNKLKATPDELSVLGNGLQSKPYVHVSDCVEAILFMYDKARGENPAIYNIAPSDSTTVKRIAELCVAASPNPKASIVYGESAQGWAGDVPKSRLDPGKLGGLGFRVRHTSDEAVQRAVREIARESFT